MTVLLADTFTDSLSRFTGEEQKAVKTTAFDLQMNPTNPGMKLHLHPIFRLRRLDFTGTLCSKLILDS